MKLQILIIKIDHKWQSTSKREFNLEPLTIVNNLRQLDRVAII